MSMKSVYVVILACVLVSCSKSSMTSSDGTEAASNISESAMSEAGQQASSSEGAAAPFTIQDMAADFDSMDYLDPADGSAHAQSACAFSIARSACSSNVDTITWGGCTVGFATLSGGWTETWSGGFCADGTKPGLLTSGNSVTRTSSSQVLTLPSGATLTTDTNAHNDYDGTSIGSGVTVSNTAGTRTVTIAGLHKVMVGPHGRTWFDHSFKSGGGGLSVVGTRAAGTRVVTGTSTLYHNLAKYTAVHTFNSVTWGSASCCYPTSGSISTSLTGTGRSGSVSLAFSSTCGQATFTDTDSTTSMITLNQCN
jgi:hypothetical protein